VRQSLNDKNKADPGNLGKSPDPVYEFLNSVINMLKSQYVGNAIKVLHNHRGTEWEDARSGMFVSDVQMYVGYGHSGYPIMGSIDWGHLFTLWSSSMKHDDHPGFVHVIGYYFQVGEATLLSGAELNKNIYRLIVDEINLELKDYTGYKGTGQWSAKIYQRLRWGHSGKLSGNGFVGARK
ncbi:hypothetical protein CRM22_010899, partial [Opisthorchis felineus]